MIQGQLRLQSFKIWLAAFWLMFSTAMVLWWWSLGLQEIKNSLSPEAHAKYRMLMWEGVFFLSAILIGGVLLIYYMIKEYQRQKQVKVFFSTFSHDLKTSISRLRLQADVLKEQGEMQKNPQLLSLVENINRLDLQLENSLFLSEEGKLHLLREKIPLSRLIQGLRNEWDELDISLEKEAVLVGDLRAYRSIFRNLIQNALLHGQATKIFIRSRKISESQILILVCDNGRGYDGDLRQLGLGPQSSSHSSGNGIGLYLTKILLERQNAKMEFKSPDDAKEMKGLCVEIQLEGEL